MTENQVKHRAKQLGLKFDQKVFNEKEKQIFKEFYGILPMKELIKKLPNRSEKAIRAYASKNGFSPDRSVIWTKEEDEKLFELYPKQGSKMFDELPNKTKWQIQKRVAFLNIKKESTFDIKMQLVRQAARDGVILSKNNPFYKGVNLYEWKISNRKKFTAEELEVINKVIPNRKIPVKMVDLESKSTNFYSSMVMAACALKKDFYILQKEESVVEAIRRRVVDKVIKPYKGRFMFYYATDEEIRQYFSDNRAS